MNSPVDVNTISRVRRRRLRRLNNGRERTLHSIETPVNGFFTCFYTDQLCKKRVTEQGDPWLATIEHLVARCDKGNNDPSNIVISSAFVNRLIGNAPLIVKMRIRNECRKIRFFPTLNETQRWKILVDFIHSILWSYRLEGIRRHPWHWKGHEDPVEMEILRRYNEQLTTESESIKLKVVKNENPTHRHRRPPAAPAIA